MEGYFLKSLCTSLCNFIIQSRLLISIITIFLGKPCGEVKSDQFIDSAAKIQLHQIVDKFQSDQCLDSATKIQLNHILAKFQSDRCLDSVTKVLFNQVVAKLHSDQTLDSIVKLHADSVKKIFFPPKLKPFAAATGGDPKEIAQSNDIVRSTTMLIDRGVEHGIEKDTINWRISTLPRSSKLDTSLDTLNPSVFVHTPLSKSDSITFQTREKGMVFTAWKISMIEGDTSSVFTLNGFGFPIPKYGIQRSRLGSMPFGNS